MRSSMGNYRAFKRLSGLTGGTDRDKKQLIPEDIEGDFFYEVKEPRVNEIVSRMRVVSPADVAMARRVAGLMDRWTDATIPELITYDYLEHREIPFRFRGWIVGSRSRGGSIEGDFILQYGGTGMAWMVDGVFWHGKPDRAALDQAGRAQLIGQVAFGIRIDLVIALQEDDIYNNRPQVFELALSGIELPVRNG